MNEIDIISNPPSKPQGDWISLEFIPIDEVSDFIPIGGKCAITVSRDFRKITVATDIHHESSRNDNGSYSHTITASIALRTAAVHGVLNTMAISGRFIVRLTDFIGTREIFGSVDNPLRFSWQEASAGNADTTITFSGDTLWPSLLQM